MTNVTSRNRLSIGDVSEATELTRDQQVCVQGGRMMIFPDRELVGIGRQSPTVDGLHSPELSASWQVNTTFRPVPIYY